MFKNTKIFICLLSLIIFIFYSSIPSFADDINLEEEQYITDENIINTSSSVISTTIPAINSRSAIVLDRNSENILYGKNQFNKVKMASTTKIMTSTIIIENCNLNDIVTVSKKAANTGGSRLGLSNNDKLTVRDLLYGLMLRSGNDAAVALAEHCSGNIDEFSKLMNKKAASLNLSNSHFETPHGLDSDNHYTTAYELALLSNYALKNKTFSEIVGTKITTIYINNNPRQISNTNELLGNLNGIYGIKTGFTNGANRCLVTACKRNDLDIICVVLGADTKRFRTTDSIKLIEYTFSNFVPTNISDILNNKLSEWKDSNLENFKIEKNSIKSDSLNIKLDIPDNTIISIQKSKLELLKISISCNSNLVTPLSKNTILGFVSLEDDESILYTSNILLDSNLYKKDFFEYYIYLLKSLKIINT